MPNDIAAAVGAASFWLFVAIVVVAGVMSSVLRHRETQKTIRQVIEKGQTLDPQTLERLLQSGRPPQAPLSRTPFLIGGIMMLAIGGGLALIGWFQSHSDPSQIYVGLGVGSLLGLLGVGLMLASLVIPPKGRG
jgi:hypothetical protein